MRQRLRVDLMKLKELMKFVEDSRLVGDGNVEVTGIDYDSRRIKAGMLFVAVSGFKMNGNDFIADAVNNGAVAILTDEDNEMNIPH